jgi:hypothetical protein
VPAAGRRRAAAGRRPTAGGGGSNAASPGGSSGGESSSGAGASGSSSGGTASSGGGAASSSGSSGGAGQTSSGSSGGGSTSQPTNLAVTAGMASVQMQLLDDYTLPVLIAPNGYSGPVTLGTGNLPSGVTATFDSATAMLDGSTTVRAMLTLKTATSVPPGTASFVVTVGAGGATKSASVSLDVQSVITLHIPAGVDNMGGTVTNPITTAFGPYPIKITAPQGLSSNNPVTVYFQNDDSVSHEIHADAAAQGFGHDPGPFGAGKMDPYVRKVNTAGTYDFYLHDQGAPITIGRLIVQ